MKRSSRATLVAALLAVSVASAAAAPPTASRSRAIAGRTVYHYASDQRAQLRNGAPATVTDIDATGVDQLPDGSLIIPDAQGFLGARETPSVLTIKRTGRVYKLKLEVGPSGDVAVLPDGGYLLSQPGSNCVLKVSARGTPRAVAGQCEPDGSSAGFGGDGGPATAAKLSSPKRLTVTRDGGFFVSDGGNADPALEAKNVRVRRVAPDGTITTVAGNGSEGSAGDGGPATAASFSDIVDLEAQRDGGLLIADRGAARVRRVGTDGVIRTVARIRPMALAALRGGAFLVVDGDGALRRVSATGAVTTLAGRGHGGTGVPARRAGPLTGNDLTVLRDGSIVTTRELIAAPGQRRLLVGMPARTNAYRRAVVRHRSIPSRVTRRCRVTVSLRYRDARGWHTLLPTSAVVGPGKHSLRLRRALRAGERNRLYGLHVTARSGRRVATANVPMIVR